MIHMDIDTLSSPSLCQRYVSVKRARSPEPSSPQDRPSKRLSLNSGIPSTFSSLNVRRHFYDHSAGSSRHSSEDWVQQAGGLTIDSPVLAGVFSLLEPEDNVGVQKDDDMLIEGTDRDVQETIRLERPQLPLLRTSGYTPSFATSDQEEQNQPSIPSIMVDSVGFSPFQEPLGYDECRSQPSLLEPNPNVGPSISVIPPTPMERQTSQDYQPINSTLTMDSNTGPPVVVTSPSLRLMTSRKQPRFMMGPRADCEKCRLGVRGHFVHLD